MEINDHVEQGLLTHDIHVQATYRLTEALVASEKRMRRRIELLSEVVFETDSQGALTFLNRAWTEVLGHETKSSLSKLLRNFVAPEDRPILDSTFAIVSGPNSGVRPQIRMLHRNMGMVWVELSVSRLDDGGLVGTLHDVNTQRLAQAEVAMLSLVASFTDSLVIISDAAGCIEWVNEAFSRKTGYCLQDAVGRKPGSFLQGPGTDTATVSLIHSRLLERRSFQCEILNYTKSGEEYWVSIHISPILNASGDVQRFIAIQTDITELRRTQQDLKAAKEAAESASEAKTQFLATISHEMRTPLNVILGTTELALENSPGAEHRHHLTRINENAEALLGLISDLLDVSRIEAGQFEWERIAFPLRTCLQKALAPIAERAIRKGLSFHIHLDEHLPEKVMGDPVRLRQIVVNLAENAVKFTERGFIRVEAKAITPGPGRNETGLELRITDSGIGIPESIRPRVFDRFFQGDGSTTRRKGGAGLGLSIVKSLVDAMGGSIRVASEPTAGAEFHVLLPLEPVSSAEGNLRELTAPPNGPDAILHSGTIRILVVEDNDDNFAIVQRHLSNRGYQVERAVNGRLGADLAMRSRFDLILMDLEMPEMDGLQATQVIRAAEGKTAGQPGPGVPIIALTAHAVKGYQERCLQSGCTGYLAKPIRKQALLDAVEAALSESGATIPAQSDGTRPIYVDIDPDLADLVPRFLENCSRDVAQIRQTASTGDWEQALRVGHGMKGSAPSYGFDEISHIAKEIGAAAKAQDSQALQSAAERLATYLLAVRTRTRQTSAAA